LNEQLRNKTHLKKQTGSRINFGHSMRMRLNSLILSWRALAGKRKELREKLQKV
jgi:hypothetical protein